MLHTGGKAWRVGALHPRYADPEEGLEQQAAGMLVIQQLFVRGVQGASAARESDGSGAAYIAPSTLHRALLQPSMLLSAPQQPNNPFPLVHHAHDPGVRCQPAW